MKDKQTVYPILFKRAENVEKRRDRADSPHRNKLQRGLEALAATDSKQSTTTQGLKVCFFH